MTRSNLQHELLSLGHELRLRRRQRLLVRSFAAALLWLAAGLALQLQGPFTQWPLLLFGSLASLLGGSWYAWRSAPSLLVLARSYDRHYALQQQLATALEVVRQDQQGVVADRLCAQATLAVRQFHHAAAARPRIPWREWEILGAMSVVIVALMLIGNRSLPNAPTPVALPALPTAIAGTTAAPAQDQPAAATAAPPQPNDKAAADALADALSDSGATRPAADALRRGDTGGAADQLRDLAGRANELSPEARQALADDLKGAADRLRAKESGRAADLDQIAGEMAQQPNKALGDLAQMVDGLGQSGQQQSGQQPGGDQAGQQPGGAGQAGASGAGNGLGGEKRSRPSNPPTAGGAPLPLPTSDSLGGPRTNAGGPQGPTIELGAGGTGSAANNPGGGGSTSAVNSAPDPLSIPPEDRDVVENYFSPAR